MVNKWDAFVLKFLEGHASHFLTLDFCFQFFLEALFFFVILPAERIKKHYRKMCPTYSP